jgi:hypothetical protein
MPTLQMGSKKASKKKLRIHRTKGGLAAYKITDAELDQLRDVSRELPMELLTEEQMKLIIIDTGKADC